MNARVPLTEDEPRLYSKPRSGRDRVAVDEVKPEHRAIHADLERWGAWNRERKSAGTCESLEKNFDDDGGRTTKRSTVSLPTDPRLVAIEAVMRRMHYGHHLCIKLFYAKRLEPNKICHAIDIRYEDFAQWMYDARQMVINLLAS